MRMEESVRKPLPDKENFIHPEMTVLDVVSRHRETEAVFKQYDEQAGECICCQALFEPLKNVAANYNLDLIGDYQSMSDNGMPPGGVEELWETPQTLNDTWGYSKFDQKWKSTGEVIWRLVEIVSKGGNYLLNIGPRGDGTIPEASIQILNEVGAWMDVYSESIYGTTASPLNVQSWGVCTARDSLLYLHVLNWPKDRKLEVSGLKNKPLSAYLLGSKSKLEWRIEGSSIMISLPEAQPDPYNSVIALQVSGQAESDPPIIFAQAMDTITLGYMTGVTSGNATKRFNRKGNFFISRWSEPEDQVTWTLQLDQAAEYSVRIVYSAPNESVNQEFEVEVGGQKLEGQIQPTGIPFEYQVFDMGNLQFQEAGTYKMAIHPSNALEGDLMYFHSLMLIPK